MSRDEVIIRIQSHAEAIRALGVGSLYVYGSAARNEAGPKSDIDIFVDRDPGKKFGFLELTNLEFLLEDVLGQEVDLSTRTALHPSLSSAIQASAVRVL